MDELLEQLGHNNAVQVIQVIQALVELSQMFLNSSSKTHSDMFVSLNGVLQNCSYTPQFVENTEYLIFGLSLLVLPVFAFMTTRVSCRRALCHARPGLALPMDPIHQHRNFYEYTLAYLSVSEDIYEFIFGFKEAYGPMLPILKLAVKLLVVMLLTIQYYALFVGFANKHIVGYFVALVLIVAITAWNIISTINASVCLVGTKLIPFIIKATLFVTVDVLLILLLLYKIVRHFLLFRCVIYKPNSVDKKPSLTNLYVQELLRPKSKSNLEFSVDAEKPQNGVEEEVSVVNEAKASLLDNLRCTDLRLRVVKTVYRKIPGFSMPPRLVIGIFVGSYFSLRIFLDFIYDLTPIAWKLLDLIHLKYKETGMNVSTAFRIVSSNQSLFLLEETLNAHRFLVFYYAELLIGCIIAGTVFGYVNSVVHSFLIVRNYRHHFHRLVRRGFSSMLELKKAPSPSGLVLGFVRFSGFQAAFILWGILIVVFTITFLLYFLVGVVLLPLFYVRDSWSYNLLVNFGQVLLASILLNFIQSLVVKYVFMRDRDNVMELDNQRTFIVFAHSAFFFNAMVGLFSSVKRIIVWLFCGIICLGRIDFNNLPDYIRSCDSGYVAYLGFLYTELYHHNPILRCFAGLLLEAAPLCPAPDAVNGEASSLSSGHLALQPTCERPLMRSRHEVVKFKWLLAYTLCRNEGIAVHRKRTLMKQESAPVPAHS